MIKTNARFLLSAVLCAAMVFSAGCVTKRWVQPLEVARAEPGTEKKKGAVVIRSLRDAREFMKNAKDPAMPNLISASEGSAFDDLKKRAIGCKRSSYQVGADVKEEQIDVLLPEGRSVEDVVRALVGNALAALGYRVAEGEGAAGDIVLDVTIQRFWAWNSPGKLTTFDLNAAVETAVDITRGGKQERVTVSGEAKKKAMSVGKKSWAKIYRPAFDKYLKNANEVFSKALP